MNLHFLNYNHNGDIHYSRKFMEDMVNIISPEKCFLHMNRNKNILKDIQYLEIKPPLNFLENTIIENDIYIVTWIGYYFGKIINTDCGVSLTSNYKAFKHVYSELGIENELKEIEFYIPTINYNNVEKYNIDNFFNENNKKTILISNGDVLSGQSENFDFTPIVYELSTTNPNVNFILTHINNINLPNVFFTSNIININDCDLLEISYLSTKCNIIIGRVSGPACFSHTKENFYNKNKTFIGFTNNEWESNWHHLVKNGAKFIWSNNYNKQNIIETIQKEI